MKTKTILASLAVSALALAQPAAAATRSYQSIPASGVTAPARAGADVGDAESVRGAPIVPIVITFAVLAALILLLSGGKSNG